MMRRYRWWVVIVFALALVLPSGAVAQQFPTKDITLVVPWAAGGGTDTIARTLVKNAKKYFGVNVSVVNKTGGLGAIMRKDDNGNSQSNGHSEMRPAKVGLKVEKNRDGKLGKTEILSGYPRSRIMTKEEYQRECEAAMEI